MADYTDNLNLILPGDDDYTLVGNLTDDFQAIDDFAGDVVKVYDPTTTHSKREYCIYQDHLYKCNSFITQPEAFDPSKWDRVILGDEVRNNNSYITNLQSGLAIVQDGDTATKAITQGQYVLWKSSMRYAKANIAIGETLGSTNLGLVSYENGALNRLSEQIANYTKIYDRTGAASANDTFQIPNFSNYDVYTIVLRRYGFAASVTLPKFMIVDGAAGSIILHNTSGDATDNKTVFNISTTGLVTITSTTAPVFVHVIATKN